MVNENILLVIFLNVTICILLMLHDIYKYNNVMDFKSNNDKNFIK